MLIIQQTSDPNAILDQQAEDDAFYAATLKEMVAMGLEIGRIVHQQVIAQSIDSPHSPIDDQSTVSYDRVFRAVRRGIMLAKRLKDPEPVRKQAAARRQVARDVGNAIKSQAKSPKDAENLYADLRDRLDTPDFEEDLENRPIQDIIDEIRKDLGLKPANPVARIAPSQCGTTQDETNETPPATVARIAPSQCGTTQDQATTDLTQPSPACGRGEGNPAEEPTQPGNLMAPAPCGTTNQNQTTQIPATHPRTPGPPYPTGS